MRELKIKIVLLLVFIFFVHSVFAISNVQHTVDGNKVTITYQGTPPFWINIRGDTNIGQAGGYLWAKTYSNSFTYDMGFAINPSKKFYYGVKDKSWSSTNSFVLGQTQNSCQNQGGNVCEDYQVCDGSVLSVSDTDRCCSGQCKLPKSFDWRNRHGENWNTPIRNQGSLAACTSFGGIAAIEAAINLYYNQHLNIDLSEMATLSCGNDLYHSFDLKWNCTNINSPAIFMCNAKFVGMLDENCYPYVDHITPNTFVCDNLCDGYKNRLWRVTDFVQMLPDSHYTNWVLDENNNVVYSGPLIDRLRQEHISEEALLKSIIKYGIVGLDYHLWGHGIAIVGWGYDSDNKQYWIIKNSWGDSWEDKGYGKIYDSNMSNFVVGIVKTPIISPQGINYQISCVDKDKDGFCNWGISENKPTTCSALCKPDKDWDDSSSNVGALGIY